MRICFKIALIVALQCYAAISQAQTDNYKADIEKYIGQFKQDIGVVVLAPQTEPVLINAHNKYTMGSLDAYYLTIFILNQVDKGILSLEQNVSVKIDKNSMQKSATNTLGATATTSSLESLPSDSPLPEAEDLSLISVLTRAINDDEINARNALYQLVGGPSAVYKFFENMGVKEFAIEATPAKILDNEALSVKNWISPSAAMELHTLINQEQNLSGENKQMLWKLLYNASRSKGNIAQSIPEDVMVAHKLGKTNRPKSGNSLSMNDLAVVTLPSGQEVFIGIFINNSQNDEQTNGEIIANIGKIIYTAINK